MPVEAAAITELLKVWQLCTQSQNCFYWGTVLLYCCWLPKIFVFFSHLSNCKGLGRKRGQREPRIVICMEAGADWWASESGFWVYLVKVKARKQSSTPPPPMREVTCVNSIPIVYINISWSSRCYLARKYSLPRMRTLWVTPQWASLGWTCGRISNG